MNQAQRGLRHALVLSCIVIGYASLGFGQANDPKSSAIIDPDNDYGPLTLLFNGKWG